MRLPLMKKRRCAAQLDRIIASQPIGWPDAVVRTEVLNIVNLSRTDRLEIQAVLFQQRQSVYAQILPYF